jgi:MFS family permease
MTDPATQPISLDLLPRGVLRRRAAVVSATALVIGAALGGILGLFVGRIAGLVAAVVVAVPLLVLAMGESRRRCWLDNGVVHVRVFGTRSVDLRGANRIELLITEVRGTRAVGVLIAGPPKGKTINVAVATYTGLAGRELDILALRRLADALAGGTEPRGLVFAELLVAQLRAEARGEAAAGRPLYRIAALAPGGRLAHRVPTDAVTQFVAALD